MSHEKSVRLKNQKRAAKAEKKAMRAEGKVKKKALKKTTKVQKRTVKAQIKLEKKTRKAEKKLRIKTDKKNEKIRKVQRKLAKKQAKKDFKKLPRPEKKRVRKEIRHKKRVERKRRRQIRHAKEPTWKPAYSNRISADELMNIESEWGGILFGPIPAGHQRNFFEYKKNVWIWYEGWLDRGGVAKGMTIRYEVRPAGVFKRVDNQKYEKITGQELDYFRMTLHQYLKLMKSKLYY